MTPLDQAPPTAAPPGAPAHPRTPLAALVVLAAALAGLTIFLAAGPATAQDGSFPPRFWDRCDSSAPAGERCGIPRGVAANPQNGRVYLADQDRNRIAEYSAWGEFLRAWGWDVVETGPNDTAADEFEVCVPAEGDACKSGTSGPGSGQLTVVQSVAVDSAGDVYVAHRTTAQTDLRLEKFDVSDAGVEWAWTVGGDVNQGPNNPGNLCTAAHLAAGDACGAGSPGTDPGQFGNWPLGNFIAIGPADEVWVGDEGRIQRFNTSGVYQSEIAVPGERVRALAVDPAGNLYASFLQGTIASGPSKPNVRKLSPAGADLGSLAVDDPRALATDPDGNVLVVDGIHNQGTAPVQQMKIHTFSPSGALIDTFEDPRSSSQNPDGLTSSFGIAANPVTPDGDIAVYIANTPSTGGNTFLRAYSPTPDPDLVGPPPLRAPDVDEFVGKVAITEAAIGAEVNPHFWDDVTFYAEYGPEGPCDANPCEQVGLPGLALDAGVTDTPKAVTIPIAGLEPRTTYHFRFVASSSGGGPTVGAGGSFTTYPREPDPRTDCPNQQFRTGPGARLPDCRAYEMVSPVDKNGADISRVGLVAAADGERLFYQARKAFGEDAKSAPYQSTYLATRNGEAGWSTQNLDPASEAIELAPDPVADALTTTGTGYLGFSEDLATAWVRTITDPPPDPAGVVGYRNLYRRDNLTDAYTALTTVTPPTRPGAGNVDGVEHYRPRINGFSTDGSHAVFSADDRLLAQASSATGGPNNTPIRQLYEHRDGEPLRLVSVLPNGTASNQPSTAGGETSYLTGAVSADGARIYWTTGTVHANTNQSLGGTATGRIYVRIDGAETIPVSETVAADEAQFWAASRDGSEALFSFVSGARAGELYRFELAGESSELIATGVGGQGGVGGVSEDLERAYFVSTEVLDPEPNSNGDGAVAGQENIYFHERGEDPRFVATVRARFGIGDDSLPRRLSQATPDGRRLAFVSERPLTGYDSRDALSGEAAIQVFRYDAQADELRCVSCNPSGARPRGATLSIAAVRTPVAARIPGWSVGPFDPPRALSEDGDRLYFEGLDALLPGDNNGRMDVYEWRAPGTGECSTDSAHYFAQNGGCLALISTGRSSDDSSFAGTSADGSSVFIRTSQSLLAHDPGLYDAYVARIGGGIAAEQAPVPCEGDGCQPPVSAPEDQTPASADFEGHGNQRPASDCAALQRQARRAAQRSRSQRQRAKKLRQRASRQARRGNARKAKRVRMRAKKVGRRARSQRQRAKRMRGQAQRCRAERAEGGSEE